MIHLSPAQRRALSDLIGNLRTPPAMARRARVLLHAAAGATNEQIMDRLELERKDVEETLKTWKKAEKKLRAAERAGANHLFMQIRMLLAPISEHGIDCTCGCRDEEHFRRRMLSDEQIAKIAARVYELLRYELRIERERIAFSRYNM